MSDNWYQCFRTTRNIPGPDGRPLFAYRVDENEFASLREALRQLQPHHRPHLCDHEAGMFLLFISEWFRRSYKGGAWTYGDVFKVLGAHEQPDYQLVIEPLVERGFKFWRRSVRRNVDGHALRLATAICEGGLPLQLVKRDGASLREYLRAILNDVARTQDGDREAAALYSAQTHAEFLPASLNHDFVHVLVSEIVFQAWQLQQKLPDQRVDPLTALDAIDAKWRERFPVVLDDDIASTLVRQLVIDARHACLLSAGEVGFGVELVRLDEVRCIVQRRLPVGLYAATPLCAALGIQGDHPTRMTLFAHAAGQPPRAVAWATLIAHDDAPRYRLEPPGRRELPIFGVDVVRLGAILGDGRDLAPMLVAGSMLPQLPLVFEQVDGAKPARLIGVGRTTTRRASVVVVYSSAHFVSDVPLSPIGLLDDPNTVAVNLAGTAIFSGKDDELRCTVAAGAEHESDAPPLRLVGTTAMWQAAGHPTFVGMPRVLTGGRTSLPIPEYELRWKPAARGRNWQPMSRRCLGDVVIRHVRDDEVQNEARICVLPASVQIETQFGAKPELGVLILSGLQPQRLRIAQPVEVVETATEAGRTRFTIRAVDPEFANIAARLDFGDDRSAIIFLPFPAKGVRFINDRGQRLTAGATVSLDSFSGIRAEAFGYSLRDKVNVEAVVVAADLPSSVKSTIRFQLQDHDGWKSLKLHTVLEELRHLISLSRSLDARVVFKIEALGLVGRIATLKVARYDTVIQPEHQRGMLTLQSAGKGQPPTTARVRVEALPLATLDQKPDALRAIGNPPDEWDFAPTTRTAGPWLVTAWEGTRCIARPLLWTVSADAATGPMPNADSALVSAMCVRNASERLDAIHLVLRQLSSDADADWRVIGACLMTVGVLPTATFDVLTALVDHPKILIGALLRQDKSNQRNLWLRLPDLLFVWETLPIAAWRHAMREYRDRLVRAWDATEALRTHMPRERLLAGSFECILKLLNDADGVLDVHQELLHEAVPDCVPRPRDTPQLRLEAARTAIGRTQIQHLLSSEWKTTCALHQVEHWENLLIEGEAQPPECLILDPVLRERTAELWQLLQVPAALGFRRPVAFAPLVSAIYAASGTVASPMVLESLKRLKAFDPKWFEAAYPNFLACALALIDR